MTKKLYPVDRYDEDTGKREVVIEFTCPFSRFWTFGHYPVIDNTYTHLKDIPDDID